MASIGRDAHVGVDGLASMAASQGRPNRDDLRNCHDYETRRSTEIVRLHGMEELKCQKGKHPTRPIQ
jgi:hypothetical protein